MKNLITALFTLVLVVGGFNVAAAQQDASIDASATIQGALEITSGSAVNFGNVGQGINATLDPVDDQNHQLVGSNANLGDFSISGGNGQTVYVYFDDTELIAADPQGTSPETDDIPYLVEVAGHDNTSTTRTTTDGESTVVLDATDGTYSLWVGGELQVGSSQETGLYEGEVTVTIEYE